MTQPAAIPTTDSAMYQTMHRQPSDVRRVLTEGWAPAKQAAELLAPAVRVMLVGIGTSYHAALVGSWLLRAAGSDARAISSFDFVHYPESFPLSADDAVVILTHTGVKQFSAAALARAAAAGATIVSVGSHTAEHPGSRLVLRTTERERSAAYTSSHLTAMTVLAQVATELGERRGAPGTRDFRAALGGLPDAVAGVLAREAEVLPVSRSASARQIYAVGAGPNEATALEAVIKVREAAYGRIDALALEQYIHGPMVSLNAGDLVVVVNVPGAARARVEGAVAVFGGIGADLWLVGGTTATAPAHAAVFDLPALPEMLSPLLAVVPMQILAYQLAANKGIHPDTFRRDHPKHFAAMSHIKL